MFVSVLLSILPAVLASPLRSNATWALLAWSEGKDDVRGNIMVDVDLFDQHDQIADLKAQGHVVICYYSAGTAESWRPDVTANKTEWNKLVVGQMSSWDEGWLDITQLDGLKKVMTNRLNLAKQYGCDGVEPDNTDCYDNDDCYTKIPSSQSAAKKAQIAYNTWTSEYVHSLGMIVGLKNTADLVGNLHSIYDFAVIEQCLEYDECDSYSDFHSDGKPMFGIEYKVLSSSACDKASSQHVAMKYCKGKNDQECASGATLDHCW